MTPRQRVLAALSRRVPDRVPKHLELTPALLRIFQEKTGAQDPADYFGLEVRQAGPGETVLRTDFTPYLGQLPPDAHVNEWGIGWVRGSVHHFEDMVHPLAERGSPEDLASYPWPDVTAPYRWADFENRVRQLQSLGHPVMGIIPCVGGTIFETAWQLRGLENLLVDFHQNQEFAYQLLDHLTEMACLNAARIAAAGADSLQTADDVGTQRGLMMNPQMWRQWLKPRLARVIAAARQVKPEIHVFYHSDGDIGEIVEDLIETGVDVLNPVQPECMDPAQMKRRYGDRLAFWGTVGTQTTFPFATPQQMRQVVRERIETVGAGGGLLIAPTHVLEPDVPWENVVAFVEAVHEYGRAQ